MDPNATLVGLRAALAKYNATRDADEAAWHATDLAMYVEALDEWLTNGGFPPEDWDWNDITDRMAKANH